LDWLNFYHNKVFKNLKRFMNKKEKVQLRQYCSNI